MNYGLIVFIALCFIITFYLVKHRKNKGIENMLNNFFIGITAGMVVYMFTLIKLEPTGLAVVIFVLVFLLMLIKDNVKRWYNHYLKTGDFMLDILDLVW